MKYYIAKIEDLWKDEIDLFGINVLTEEEKISLEKTIKRFERAKTEGELIPITYCGTNEEMETYYINVPEIYEVSEITYNEIKKIIPKSWGGGWFPDYDDLINEDYLEELKQIEHREKHLDHIENEIL